MYVIQIMMTAVIITCMTYLLLCVQYKTPDDGQRNCPKHVEFYSKNKFEKLMHLVGFIIRILPVWLAQYVFCYKKTLKPAMRNGRSSKTSTIHIRNIRGILNTSNKQMLLKLYKTVAGQGLQTSVRIY
jgi:hypothetical protein